MTETGTSHSDLAMQVGLDDDALRAKRLGRRSLEVGEGMRLSYVLKLPADYLFSYASMRPANTDDFPLRRGRPQAKKDGEKHGRRS